MKKLIVAILVLFIGIVGCEKEKTNHLPPSINFITGNDFVSSDTILGLGESFRVGIDARNPNVNLTNFIIKVETDILETYLDSGMNTPILHFEKYLTKGIKESEKWIFIIRDKDGSSSEVSLLISIDTSSVFGGIDYFQSVELGAQNNSDASFFSCSDGLSYTLSEAYNYQDKIDMCYYYDFIDTDENTIASPGANIDESVYIGEFGLNNWTTRRTSRFKIADITESDFYNATNDSLLLAAYGQAEGNRKAKNLQQGSIFAFKNEDGKIGLFMVNSLSGTDDGLVNISIKIQE
ncbi:MAG: hypothetical protein HQ521_04745 [Bacteroidetes bacterium]|nr:hypothetical protein [Bacteroidota bacterium]